MLGNRTSPCWKQGADAATDARKVFCARRDVLPVIRREFSGCFPLLGRPVGSGNGSLMTALMEGTLLTVYQILQFGCCCRFLEAKHTQSGHFPLVSTVCLCCCWLLAVGVALPEHCSGPAGLEVHLIWHINWFITSLWLRARSFLGLW